MAGVAGIIAPRPGAPRDSLRLQPHETCLVLGADADIYIPTKLAEKELSLLGKAKSVTLRMFTMAEQAGNHCNVGDPKAALDAILDWMHRLDERDGR